MSDEKGKTTPDETMKSAAAAGQGPVGPGGNAVILEPAVEKKDGQGPVGPGGNVKPPPPPPVNLA